MPPKKRYARRRRKRTYRRRRKKNNNISLGGDREVTRTGRPKMSSVVYRGIGIPASFRTKLKYTATIDLSASPLEGYIFRANSIFDPDFAIGGGQPMYRDQFAQLYNKYCVFGCSIVVNWVQRSATAGSSFVRCGIYPLGTSFQSSSILEATERDNCVFTQLGPNTGDQGIVSMNGFIKPYAILGKSKFEKEDDTMTATMGNNPSTQCFWHLFAGTLDATANISLYAEVTLVYYVKFSDRLNVDRS